MRRPRSPFALAAAIFAGWLNRHQQAVIDYLLEENRVLRAKLGKSRIQFTDAERRRLARKGEESFRLSLQATAFLTHRTRVTAGLLGFADRLFPGPGGAVS